MLSERTVKSEKQLRDMVAKNLRKEYHAGTKPSVDFIAHILDEAFAGGVTYDLTDMRSAVMTFAAMSHNQPQAAVRAAQKIKWKSEDKPEAKVDSPEDHYGDDPVMPDPPAESNDKQIVFYDVEVYPNLFVICYMADHDNAAVIRMINPSAQEVETLLRMKLVGFYNRNYDNHILYAAYMGYSIEALYQLSQSLINGDQRNRSTFGEAYSLSYADIYDFSSKKQSLKKFQIELGLPHVEMDIPWDQPVPPEMAEKVADYCANDVRTTRSTFHSRKQDFVARQILAELSGLTVNDPTNKHTAKILFGSNRQPQSEFVYTDLATGQRYYGTDVPQWMQ